MSRLLGRLGNVGEVLLKNELDKQQSAYESNLIRQRQREASEQGVLQNVATKMGDQAVAHRLRPTDEQLAKVDAVNPRIGAMIRAQAGMVPSDEQAAGEVAAPLYKELAGAKSDEELGSENARLAQAKAGFTGVNVPLTAGDENPMWAMQDAYRAQHEQIGKNDVAKRAEDLKAAGEQKLLPGRPQTMGILQLDDNGKPIKASVLGLDGQPRPATSEDMKNPDIKWSSEKPTQPNYYQTMQNMPPMDLRGIMNYASQANARGWEKMPPLYGPSGQRDRDRIIAIQSFEDKNNPGHFIFENPNYTGPLPQGVSKEEIASLQKNNAAVAAGQAGPQQVDLWTNRMNAAASAKSYDTLTENYNSVKAFGQMANDNANLLKGVMKDLPSASGPRFLNAEVRDLAAEFGAPVANAFAAAQRAVYADYSRLTTTANLRGVLTNEAQAETKAALGEGATVGQILAALDIWKQETANREKELYAVLHGIAQGKGRNPANPPDLGEPAAPAAPQHRPGVVRRQ